MQTINSKQLKQMRERDKDISIVNTLPEDSFKDTRIPGAINIPEKRDDFVDRVEQEIGGKDQPVVVYCASTECHSSENAAAKLEQAGFTSVLDFEGGAAAWEKETAM